MTWSTTTSGSDTVLIQAASTSDTEATLFSDSVNGSPAGDDGTYLDRLGNATYYSYFLNNDSVVRVEGTLNMGAFITTDTSCGSLSSNNGVTNGLPIWTVNSGGTLTFGSEETISSVDVWNQPEIGYRGTRGTQRPYDSDNGEFLIDSGGQLDIYGCNFYQRGFIWVEGTSNIKGSKLRFEPSTSGETSQFFGLIGASSGEITLENVELYLDSTTRGCSGIQIRSGDVVLSLSGLTIVNGTEGLATAFSGTSAAIIETDNYRYIGTTYGQNIRNYSDSPNNAGLSFATPYNEWYHRNPLVYPVSINQEITTIQPGASAGLPSKGVQFQLFQYQPTVIDDSGSPIEGAELYLAGTDDGNSVDDSSVTAGTITGTGYDFTIGVLIYTAASDSNGLLTPAYDDSTYSQFGEETQDGYLITSIVARLGQTPGSEIPRNVRGPYNGGITAYGKFDIQISDLFDDTDLQSNPEGAPFTGTFTQFSNPFVDTATYPLATAAAITGIAFTAGAIVVSASKTWAEFAHYLEWRVTQTDISYRWDTARYWTFETKTSGSINANLLFLGELADIDGGGTINLVGVGLLTIGAKSAYASRLNVGESWTINVDAAPSNLDLTPWTFEDGVMFSITNGGSVSITVASAALASQLNVNKIETNGTITFAGPVFTINAPNLPEGAHYLLRYADGAEEELEVGYVAGGSGLSVALPSQDDRLIRLLAIHVTSSPLYASRLFSFTFRNSGVSVSTEEALEEYSPYSDFAIDGMAPAITSKFTFDNPNLQVDATEVDGLLSAQEVHAFGWAQMQLNHDALRLGYVPFEAFAQVGYIVRSGWQVENQSLTTPLLITDGYYVDELGNPYNPCAPATGGKQSTSVVFEPSHTVTIEGSGGLGSEDIARLESIENQLKADYWKGEDRFQRYLPGTSTVILDKDVSLEPDGFHVTEHIDP
jgi:hypothetical protein